MASQAQPQSNGVLQFSSAAKTLAGSISFSQFASLLDAIIVRPQAKKKEPLKSFLESWRKKYKELYPSNPQPPVETFFPILRLLIPEADRDRPTYGLKEHYLAKFLIEEMGLAPGGDHAQMLYHWKQRKPQNAKSEDVSDFAGVAYFVLQNRTSKKGEISIQEVNQHLDDLAAANSSVGEERKSQFKSLIHALFVRMNEGELKWLLRIILKDLKLGMGTGSIMRVYHEDAEELFDVCNSLSTVCTRLNDPEVRMSEIEISLFSFVRPMLCDNWQPDKLRVLLKKQNPLLAEIKYDGERVQIHKQGNQFKYFSRGGHDISADLGARPGEGNLTRHIADCFRPDCTSFILDGELCPYSIKEECIATKAESMNIKSLTGEHGYQACFVAFDCLLYNDKTLTAQPLTSRRNILKNLFQKEEGRLYHAVTINVTEPQECYDFLNAAIDRNEEGIILKEPTSVYKPNKREHAGWYKVKPEYMTDLSDSLDLLVVGGYFGIGRRSGPSHFLLAVAQAPDTPNTYPTKFLSLCRVGTGYTMTELQDINQKLDKHWKPWTDKSSPGFLQQASGEPKADLWVDPPHSFIVRVQAAQLLESDSFAAGCTLRFPRVREVRHDKNWGDCTTQTQLLALKAESRGRLGAKSVNDEYLTDDGSPRRKKQKTGTRATLRVGSEFRPADLHDLEVTGNIFEGKEFLVAGDGPKQSKQDLERLIAEKGGSSVQHLTKDTFCVVSQRKTAHVINMFKHAAANKTPVDVVLPAWINRCVEAGTVIPWQPEDVLLATKKTEETFASAFDKYGDSFTLPINTTDFERLLGEMEKQKTASVEELAEFEEEHLQDMPLMGLFRLCTAYVDKYEIIGDRNSAVDCGAALSLAEEYFKACGGTISEKLDENVSHVILQSSGSFSRLEEFKRVNRDRVKRFHLVTDQWVLDSYEQACVREERPYHPRVPIVEDSVDRVDVFAGMFD